MNKSYPRRRASVDLLEPRRLLAALTPGQTLESSISSASEVDTHTISLTAGQTLIVALGDKDLGAFDPQVQLRNPSAGVVRTDSNETGVFYKVTADASGQYQLRVSDAGADNTGNYKLTVFRPGSDFAYGEEGSEAESGRRRASTNEPGDLDIYTINTTKGQYIATQVVENNKGAAVDIGVILIGPNGQVIEEKISETGVEIEVTHEQTVTGRYFVIVYEPGANDNGRYGITFARLPGAQYGGDPDTVNLLKNGEKRNGDAPGGDYDVFPIYIDEGSTINAKVDRGTGSLDPLVKLFNPDGSLLATANGATTATVNSTAKISGTHWLLVVDRESDDGGRFDVEYNLSIDNADPVLENALLTINGTAGDDTIGLSETSHNGIDAIMFSINGTSKFYNRSEVERIEIYAGAGDDVVNAITPINTYIFGDVGNDVLTSAGGRDTLTGAGGKNRLFGGDGNDRMNGSGGRDFLSGQGGDDRLYGNGGSDTLDGGGNVDRLFGGDGDDSLVGGSSNDKMQGEAGNDTLVGNAGADLFDGGDGTDTRGDNDPADVLVAMEA